MKNQHTLSLGSLFSGSGGFELAGVMHGIDPIWASEIEPFPIRVTTKRLPLVEHLGDIRKINGSKIPPVDIITFGSPCTNVSLAGRREGLKGKESSLFHEAIRIIKEMRKKTEGKYPRFIIFENVPGLFSSSKGEDFRIVLEEICKIKNETIFVPMPEKCKWEKAGSIVEDNFSIAWRVFDAQYFGVPQRRKRVYLVGDFRSECASKILFESKSVCRDIKSSEIERKETSSNTGISLEKSSFVLNDQGGEVMSVTTDYTCTLRAKASKPPLLFENHAQSSRFKGTLKISQTISATFGTGGNNQPFVVETPKTTYNICSKESNAMK